ncbi:hypothetical protein J4Q44_G00302420 [Coregonus suidteri]|uniref:Secreted protein n=1 Tax=Coregonus suidteri TaxID=861788 RepID=A0AAN8QR53_9TELE
MWYQAALKLLLLSPIRVLGKKDIMSFFLFILISWRSGEREDHRRTHTVSIQPKYIYWVRSKQTDTERILLLVLLSGQ